jgi:Ca-activated chloride channel family protein
MSCASLRAFHWVQPAILLLAAAIVIPTTGCGDKKSAPMKGREARNAAPTTATPMATPHAGRTDKTDKAAGEEYERRHDNPYHRAAQEPLSTFSIDVDTASYANVRRMLNEGKLPPHDAVRVEEFVNYFTYNYPAPEGEHPISINAESATCPWNSKHQLVRIGIQGKHIDAQRMPPRNLVFLVDTSGSMASQNRLPLLKKSLALLAKQLNQRDRVTIVEYAGRAGLVLSPTPGNQQQAILAALDKLYAEGSTNGGDGIQMAYRYAQENFIKGGANRVILGTDGDFNVGLTGAALVRFIEEKRNSGVFLTVLGFGMGNYKDATLEKLAQHGNGTHAYVDSMAEAQRVFVEQIANLVPIANDVKVQVEFNPAHVQAYRLIGYENRLLNHQDFNNDAKDAGDMGAGHSVTALYEIVPHGVQIDMPKMNGLKYQEQAKLTLDAKGNEVLSVGVRYLPPTEKQSRLVTAVVTKQSRPFAEASRDFRFAASVASFAMILRESPHKGETSFAQVHQWAKAASGQDELGHRREFLRLVQAAERLSPANGANRRD